MAISYVGGVAGGRAGSTGTTTQSINGTLTGGSNTSPSAGDIVVVWCSAAADTTAAATQTVSGNTSGTYNTETQQSQLGTTYDSYAQLNWRVQGSTPDTTITIPSSGSIRNAQRWAIHVFRGVDQTNPWDVTSTTASGTASGRPNPPSITPSTAGAWILWLGHSAAATGAAYTAPTDFATNWRGDTTADTADDMDGFGYYTGWTSGAYDPAAITAGGTTNAADSWVAKTAVLKPAPNNYTLTASGGAYTLTGQSATLLKSKVIVASGGSYTLTGQNATLAKNRVLTASGGSYSLTGQSANLARNRTLTASGGSYSLTGQSATLLKSKKIVASGGSYTLTGQNAVLTWTPTSVNYTLTAQGGTYTVTGQSATLSRNRVMTAQGGSYTYTGQSASLNRNRTLTAQGGTYTYTGQQATLLKSKLLVASGGSYSLVGGQAVITWTPVATNYLLIAQGGTYSLTGSPATLLKSKVLGASGGVYSLTGGAADIVFSGGSTGSSGTSRLVKSGLPQKQSDLKLPRELIEKLQAESLEADLKKKQTPEPVVAPEPIVVAPKLEPKAPVEEVKPPFSLKPVYEYLRASNEEKRISEIIRGLTIKTDLQIQFNAVKYQRALFEDQAQKDLEEDLDIELLLMSHI